jgi:regulator of replication initiation timing
VSLHLLRPHQNEPHDASDAPNEEPESNGAEPETIGLPDRSVNHQEPITTGNAPATADVQSDPASDGTESKDRFDALVRDRDSLRVEVADMRKSLEEIQSKHTADMKALQQKLDDAESKKEQAETQYQKLLERVNTIKSQLGERLKEDAVRCLDFTIRVIWLTLLYRRNCPLRDRKLKSLRTKTPTSEKSWIPSLIKCLNSRAIQ